MAIAVITFLIIGLILAGIFFYPILIKRRRSRIKTRPFPCLWQAIVENSLPMYNQLSPKERRGLKGHIQVFLAEKQFIGCGGLQVTEEMKLTVAAIACLLLLNEQGEYFPKLRSILIYPSTYFVDKTTPLGNYLVEVRREARLGESWDQGQLVLSWAEVKKDTSNWNDGHNVVLHEFAHQLDQANGKANGVPMLLQNSDYLIWSQVMTKEYQRLECEVQQGVKTVMDSYGATNPIEFFAVATETFFEKPHQLLKNHPELYKLLQYYYQLDPVSAAY